MVHRDLFTPHPVLNPNKTVHRSKINAHLRSRYPWGEELPKRHWSNGQHLRLPSEGSGFNFLVAQTFSSVTSCAFTAAMGIIISHAFTAIFGLISRVWPYLSCVHCRHGNYLSCVHCRHHGHYYVFARGTPDSCVFFVPTGIELLSGILSLVCCLTYRACL